MALMDDIYFLRTQGKEGDIRIIDDYHLEKMDRDGVKRYYVHTEDGKFSVEVTFDSIEDISDIKRAIRTINEFRLDEQMERLNEMAELERHVTPTKPRLCR